MSETSQTAKSTRPGLSLNLSKEEREKKFLGVLAEGNDTSGKVAAPATSPAPAPVASPQTVAAPLTTAEQASTGADMVEKLQGFIIRLNPTSMREIEQVYRASTYKSKQEMGEALLMQAVRKLGTELGVFKPE